MRRVIASIMVVLAMAMAFTGCSNNEITKMDVDPAITIEEVNDSSAQVVRAFFESLFNGNREMFEKCFPAEFIAELEEDDIDLFDQYSKAFVVDGEFAGTQYINFNELNPESGYDDWEVFKQNIADVQGVDINKIDSMQIVCIKLYFATGEENQYIELYSIAYQMDGSWYMYETQDSDAEFGQE